jgi:hypothetical protein
LLSIRNEKGTCHYNVWKPDDSTSKYRKRYLQIIIMIEHTLNKPSFAKFPYSHRSFYNPLDYFIIFQSKSIPSYQTTYIHVCLQ